MKRPPFPALKLPLVLMLVALLLASSGVWWSKNQANQAEYALQQQHSALKRSQLQLNHSRQQQQLITTYLAAYQALAARGFIGPEDRLAWIEAAQHANRDAGLYGLDYQLTPRTASTPTLAQGLPLGQTIMTLTLPLLLESDLTRFLSALQARASGVVRVQGCRLSRVNEVLSDAIHSPQLSAECDLLWFTVSETAKKDESPTP